MSFASGFAKALPTGAAIGFAKRRSDRDDAAADRDAKRFEVEQENLRRVRVRQINADHAQDKIMSGNLQDAAPEMNEVPGLENQALQSALGGSAGSSQGLVADKPQMAGIPGLPPGTQGTAGNQAVNTALGTNALPTEAPMSERQQLMKLRATLFTAYGDPTMSPEQKQMLGKTAGDMHNQLGMSHIQRSLMAAETQDWDTVADEMNKVGELYDAPLRVTSNGDGTFNAPLISDKPIGMKDIHQYAVIAQKGGLEGLMAHANAQDLFNRQAQAFDADILLKTAQADLAYSKARAEDRNYKFSPAGQAAEAAKAFRENNGMTKEQAEFLADTYQNALGAHEKRIEALMETMGEDEALKLSNAMFALTTRAQGTIGKLHVEGKMDAGEAVMYGIQLAGIATTGTGASPFGGKLVRHEEFVTRDGNGPVYLDVPGSNPRLMPAFVANQFAEYVKTIPSPKGSPPPAVHTGPLMSAAPYPHNVATPTAAMATQALPVLGKALGSRYAR